MRANVDKLGQKKKKHNDLGGKRLGSLGDLSCRLDETPQWACEIDLWRIATQVRGSGRGPKGGAIKKEI